VEHPQVPPKYMVPIYKATWHRIQENYNINNDVTKLHEIIDCYLLPHAPNPILVFQQASGPLAHS
jgi:hypothetical protein